MHGRGLIAYGDKLDFVTRQLMSLFQDSFGLLAWQDVIYRAQKDYRSPGDVSADLRLQIAEHWLELAKAGCLDVKIDPSRGLVVREKASETAQKLQRKDLEKVLFKLLDRLPDERSLLYQEIFAALDAMTGQSLSDNLDEFIDLTAYLKKRRYIVWDDMGGAKTSPLPQGFGFR